MTFFSTDNLHAITGGRWRSRGPATAVPAGVGTDTRHDLRGKAFVALRGARHDGHHHLAAAVAAGAEVLVVDRPPSPGACPADVGVLVVADTRRALGQLARTYRRSLAATTVIAVTGSAGKTTTKNLIHAALSTRFRGTAAPRSFNNDIGVPLTILSARPHDRYLVVEVGSGAPGEIDALARLVEPDVAVITSIGHAHLGGFGTIAAIAREKAALLAHLVPGGTAFLHDTPELDPHARGLASVVRFGVAPHADLRLTDRGETVGAGGGGWFEVDGRRRFALALPGRHNAINALAAIGVGRWLGLDDETLAGALATVTPEPMRLDVVGIGGVRVFNDAYNANPESMAAALATFGEVAADAPRRILVLGDMLELGPREGELHRALGQRIREADGVGRIEHVFLVGSRCGETAATLRSAWSPSRISGLARMDDAAVAAVADRLRPGDALLVKASRGVGLDRLVDALAARAAAAEVEIKPAARARAGRAPSGAT